MRSTCILAAAIAMTFAGCQSDTMSTRDTYGNRDFEGDRRVSPADVEVIHQPLPDNPQVGATEKTAPLSALSASDRSFIIHMLASGQYEISAGAKAESKSNNSSIRTLAQHIVADHLKANSQLTNLASRKGLRIPVYPSVEQASMLAQLDSLSGVEFDNEFLRQQRTTHEQAISLLSAASNSADDRDLRDWATSTLPTIKSHFDMVNKLRGESIGLAD